MKLAVVLVDPLPTVRAGLELLIESQADMGVVAQVSTTTEVLDVLKGLQRRTSVLCLIGMSATGEGDAYWLFRKIRDTFPTVAIVGCGANADRAVVSRAFFVGADAFVDKNAMPADFLDALRRASAGEVVMVGPPAAWLGSITDDIQRQSDAEVLLSERERDVMTLAAEGLRAREIGDRLGLRERTITTHLHRIYQKLGVNSRVAAIQAATREGLVTLQSVG